MNVGTVICSNSERIVLCDLQDESGADDDCDGIDDDCNGVADESFIPSEVTCGQGACSTTGIKRCIEGSLVTDCNPLAPQGPDLCDGIDNDCDARLDEDHEFTETECGQGLCAMTGRSLCLNGVISDDCTPTQSPTQVDVCNGFDEDCDGVVSSEDCT